mgnify:CR=1 FL=1
MIDGYEAGVFSMVENLYQFFGKIATPYLGVRWGFETTSKGCHNRHQATGAPLLLGALYAWKNLTSRQFHIRMED